ncbi:hypothetical protein BDV93DRAFT_518544 [Ceratobasidium sp. AG-I]|nr:hypothetical protein BDV93DRAFT_518544 [Ceratobasidium sp. AG-I]
MSLPQPSKSSESKVEDEAEESSASSPCPRSFLSLEHEVRGDIRCLVRDKIGRALATDREENKDELDEEGDETRPDETPKTPSDELKTLALEFVACVAQEKRCTSHRMRRTITGSLAPGVVLDTPGASLFFWRLWETLVDEATQSRLTWWSEHEKSLATACDWEALVLARGRADRKTDRAVELVNLAQGIQCDAAASWSVWTKPGKWADLPLLEHIVRDYQFALFSALSQHERIEEPRIQRYVCGADLPRPEEIKKGSTRDLVSMRWKWLQLQRFSALLWNNAGRAEYFPHAMRALEALSDFSPEAALPEMPETSVFSVDSTISTSKEGNIESVAEITLGDEPVETPDVSEDSPDAVPTPDSCWDPPEPFVEWVEPPLARPPTALQVLLAEGAAVWISEATPVLRRYIECKPLTDVEKTWFGCAQESRSEREGRWKAWRAGLEKVFVWCTAEQNGLPREATVLQGVVCALRVMARVERDHDQSECGLGAMPKLGGKVCLPWCV